MRLRVPGRYAAYTSRPDLLILHPVYYLLRNWSSPTLSHIILLKMSSVFHHYGGRMPIGALIASLWPQTFMQREMRSRTADGGIKASSRDQVLGIISGD